MLDALRKNSQSRVIQVLLGAIVIVFVFWGVGTLSTGQLEVIARVNDDIISAREFDRAYQNTARSMSELYQNGFPAEFVREQTLDRLITARVLMQEAERLGLSVGENELRRSIAEMPQFRSGGQFDRNLYLRILQLNGMKPSDFEEAQRQQLLLTKMQELISAGAHVTEAQARERYRYENEKANLKVVKVPAQRFVAEITPSEDELRAYYDAHRDEFREPERVRIDYLLFDPEVFARNYEPQDQEIQAYYEEHRGQYGTPEQVRARHILFRLSPGANEGQKQSVRQRAEEVLAKARGGGDFAQLASQHSEDTGSAAQGGDLGFFGRGEMVAPFEQAAFDLAPGAISDLVETQFGFHIIKVEEKRAASEKQLDEVRGEIVDALRKQRGRDLARRAVEQAEEQLLDGESFESVSAHLGLPVRSSEPFSRQEMPAGLSDASELRDAAFDTAAGELGEVVSLPSGYVVFRVAEKQESYVPELDRVGERVADAVRKEKAAARAKEMAESLLQRLQQGEALDAVAASAGLQVEETGPFTRRGGYIAQVGNAPALREAAFELSPEKPLGPQVYEAGGDAVIAVLQERLPADEQDFEGQKAELIEQERQRLQGALFEQFVRYLKGKAQIEIGQGYTAITGG